MTKIGQTGPHAVNDETFRTIEKRLAGLGIRLRDHIPENPVTIADLEVHPLTLQGVDFTVRDPDKFLCAIRAATTGGDKAFTEGSTKASDWKQHWAMTASLLATKGIGFREPWRYYLNDRAARLEVARPKMANAPEWDTGFAGNFGEGNTLDLSALHISVAYGKWTECNIHIDETGIAMVDASGNTSLTPNAFSHLFNELAFKTILGEHLPTWFIDRVNLRLFSPEMGYDKAGVSVDVLKGKTYKLTISASCSLTSCQDIDFSKVIRLDGDALKSLNPTIGFTKKF